MAARTDKRSVTATVSHSVPSSDAPTTSCSAQRTDSRSAPRSVPHPPPSTRTAARSASPKLVPFPQILSAPRCDAEPEEGVHCRARLGGVRCEVLCGSPKYGILKWVMDQVRTVLSFKTQHPISVVEGFLFKFSYASWFVVSREEAMDQSLAPPTERKSQKYYKKFWEHFYGVHFVRTPVKVPL